MVDMSKAHTVHPDVVACVEYLSGIVDAVPRGRPVTDMAMESVDRAERVLATVAAQRDRACSPDCDECRTIWYIGISVLAVLTALERSTEALEWQAWITLCDTGTRMLMDITQDWVAS